MPNLPSQLPFSSSPSSLLVMESFNPHGFPIHSSMEMGIASLHMGEDSSNVYSSLDGDITPTIISINFGSNMSLGSDTNASSVGSDHLHGEQSFSKKMRKENPIPGSEISPHTVGSVEGKKRRQRKCGTAKEPRKDRKVTSEKPSSEYIHVRARRGQATDSHSLAERVRREKIRERMKLLQELVPGCDKVTGKAPMLDEIINYVQSLQSQVEFLSMKLASLNPIMCDFSLDDCYFEQEAVERSSPPMATVHHAGHVQPAAFVEGTKNVPFFSAGHLHTHQNGYDQKPDLQLQFGNITFF